MSIMQADEKDAAVIWTNRIRFIDRIVMKGILVIIPLAVFAFMLLVIAGFIFSGGTFGELWGGIGPLLLITFGILCFIVLAAMLTLHVITGGGYDATFAVSSRGVGFAGGKTMKNVNNALVLASLLTGSPGVAGASLVNYGTDQNFIAWKDIRSVKLQEKERYILIRPRWLAYPIPLYCTKENFGQVRAMIGHYRPDLG